MTRLQLLFLALLCTTFVFGQTEDDMKAWQNYMKPGAHHEWLAQFNGDWTGNSKVWMDPAAPPMEYTLDTKNEMVMNGLYQRSTHTGMFMGQAFVGEGLAGFDNARQKFVTSWFDNMGSGITYLEGTRNVESNTMETKGLMTDPMTGEMLEVRQVLTYIDADTHKFEMYMVAGGKEMKSMEITYVRKK